jgi:hypothetical protein
MRKRVDGRHEANSKKIKYWSCMVNLFKGKGDDRVESDSDLFLLVRRRHKSPWKWALEHCSKLVTTNKVVQLVIDRLNHTSLYQTLN